MRRKRQRREGSRDENANNKVDNKIDGDWGVLCGCFKLC